MYLLVEWTCGLVHIFVIYHVVCNWISSQDVNVLLVVPCFHSRGFQAGVYFLTLCFRGFSTYVLVCNLWTWVSPIVLIAWSTDIYIYIYICMYILLNQWYVFIVVLTETYVIKYFSVVLGVWCIQDTVYSGAELWLNAKSTLMQLILWHVNDWCL